MLEEASVISPVELLSVKVAGLLRKVPPGVPVITVVGFEPVIQYVEAE